MDDDRGLLFDLPSVGRKKVSASFDGGRARELAIACGYEDAKDLDRLRGDLAFKLACGRLPDSGGELCSQPTVSRWENAPDLKTVIRLTYAMVGAWCASYAKEPEAGESGEGITLRGG